MDNRFRLINLASWIGIVGNTILAILKISVGLIFNSLAVLSDGIDTATDIITSTITLFASKVMNKPPDEDHPYGHGRAEAIATKSLSFIIFFAGAQVGVQAIRNIISGTYNNPSQIALWVTLISIFGKIILALVKFSLGKKAESKMLIADAKNMRNDIVLSLGVFIGLGLSIFFKMPILDSITALIISFWIIYIAITIFRETSVELMDGYSNRDDYNIIFAAVNSVEGASNPHKVRIRTMSNMIIIDLDIEVDGEKTVLEGHNIATNVEVAIKKELINVYDVLVHIEPSGAGEHTERFGLKEVR